MPAPADDFPPPTQTLDVRGYLCPIPVTKAKQAIVDLAPGQVLEILGDDPVMVIDIPAWCQESGHQLFTCQQTGREVRCRVVKT